MKIIVTLLIALTAMSAYGQSDKKKKGIESDVKQVLTNQVSAWNKGDIQGFMEGYWKSDDMRFISGNNVSKGWQAAYERYKQSYDTREKMGVLSFSELEVTVLSKTAALVKGRFTLERKEDKPTGLFTLIFQKFEDGWKVIHDHTST